VSLDHALRPEALPFALSKAAQAALEPLEGRTRRPGKAGSAGALASERAGFMRRGCREREMDN